MHISAGISPERWSTRLIDRLAYAHDASMYRLVPEAVVRPESEWEVQSPVSYTHLTLPTICSV